MPNSSQAHDNLAFVLFEAGHVASALEHWNQAVQFEPTNADARAGLAIALEASGDRARAVVAYAAAIDLNSRFRDVTALRDEFLWSNKASTVASSLIAAIDS